MTHRFFIPTHWLAPPLVRLTGDTAHQIKQVLRLQAGDEIIVLDNSGAEWMVRLTEISRDSVQGQITASRPARGEPKVQLTLYQGALKAQKFEWVLQKGTELGIKGFVPVLCQRSVVQRAADLANKQVRWERIIQEAAEQSCRGELPRLQEAMLFSQAIQHAAQTHALALLAWEEAGSSLKKILRQHPAAPSIALFVGPEGGFAQAEAEQAQEAGLQLINLGPRLLRAETAGLAISAAILYELDEWA